jgi:hypothetical protein
VVEFLPREDSIVLMEGVDRLLLRPVDIPPVISFGSGVPSILEGFLDTHTDLGLVLDL